MPKRQQKSWIYKKFSSFLSELEKLNWLMIGCQIGLDQTINPILHFKKGFEKHIGIKMEDKDTFTPLLKEMGFDYVTRRDMTKFLRSEFASGNQFMNRIWTIMLWSILENYVRDFLVEWLKRKPDVLKTEAIQKLPIRFGEYESLEGVEKFEYIVDTLESQSKLGIGVARFESVLEKVGLSGKVDEKLRRETLGSMSSSV